MHASHLGGEKLAPPVLVHVQAVLNVLLLVERLEAIQLDLGVVHEHIGAPVDRRDEAVSLAGVKELDLARYPPRGHGRCALHGAAQSAAADREAASGNRTGEHFLC
eukprot:CAMPEP_0173318714 /NCGR_PEP_ID=MMETSP1143-20121109/27816_1 /TAXON_ID=483371 /ORGANISM="non described non described, Strain CCMP2298" /LENGTH=105 /DNA_ID=CAMNT_0014262001 /DNA_START=652 /DNA_END=966 /DNA_ORIENTATION=+